MCSFYNYTEYGDEFSILKQVSFCNYQVKVLWKRQVSQFSLMTVKRKPRFGLWNNTNVLTGDRVNFSNPNVDEGELDVGICSFQHRSLSVRSAVRFEYSHSLVCLVVVVEWVENHETVWSSIQQIPLQNWNRLNSCWMGTKLNTKELTYYESSGIINGRNTDGNGHFVHGNEACPKYIQPCCAWSCSWKVTSVEGCSEILKVLYFWSTRCKAVLMSKKVVYIITIVLQMFNWNKWSLITAWSVIKLQSGGDGCQVKIKPSL
jgi:hypothetical protein